MRGIVRHHWIFIHALLHRPLSNNERHYNISFDDEPRQQLPITQDILLGVGLAGYPFIAPALNESAANLSFSTASAGGACVGVVISGSHFTTGGPGAAAVLLGAVRGARLTANTCYWHGAPVPTGSRGAPTQCALATAGGNCSR